MEDREIRAALDRHWAASNANDLEGEHQIYRENAVLEYLSRASACAGGGRFSRLAPRSRTTKRFTVRRIIGAGGLWVTEYALTYGGRP
jgi:hypothetical protein